MADPYDLPPLPGVLFGMEVVDYIRREAQLGAEQVKRVRNAILAEILTVHKPLPAESLARLAEAVRLHVHYLNLLRATIFEPVAGVDDDEEEDED